MEQNFTAAQYPHALADGNLRSGIREKTRELSSVVLPAPSLYHREIKKNCITLAFFTYGTEHLLERHFWAFCYVSCTTNPCEILQTAASYQQCPGECC